MRLTLSKAGQLSITDSGDVFEGERVEDKVNVHKKLVELMRKTAAPCTSDTTKAYCVKWEEKGSDDRFYPQSYSLVFEKRCTNGTVQSVNLISHSEAHKGGLFKCEGLVCSNPISPDNSAIFLFGTPVLTSDVDDEKKPDIFPNNYYRAARIDEPPFMDELPGSQDIEKLCPTNWQQTEQPNVTKPWTCEQEAHELQDIDLTSRKYQRDWEQNSEHPLYTLLISLNMRYSQLMTHIHFARTKLGIQCPENDNQDRLDQINRRFNDLMVHAIRDDLK